MAKDAAEPKAKAPAKKGKGGGKKVTAYNTFMKNELAKLKTEKPDLPHSEKFKLVAQRWKTAKENPKNA
ncbi:hypothetical protein JKP88DRAFT_235588 [Tribonema minus]|uniref:YABBY protein C-terminal domain-containing protein n=1 Tax=Tribonema minus TaxID=303371 RepID=A0A836CIR0_9STRA|nr:hypothetical protein JKP88DRAFT_235588 [Tribonema minus]